MCNLAFIATGYIVDYDGVSVYIENILKNLLANKSIVDREFSIDIYVSQGAKELLIQRVFQDKIAKNIDIITVKDSNSIIKIVDLQIKLLFNRKYDVVFMPNPMPLFFSSGKRVKVIHDLTIKQTPELFSFLTHKYIDFLIWYMYRFDDAIGFISNQTKDDIEKFYEINSKNKKLLHLANGIPFKVQNYQRPQIEDIYKKYNSNSIEFVVIGRVNYSKGFDRILLFLNYFDKYLKDQDRFQEVILHIVGKQTDDTKDMLKKSNLHHIVLNFHGYVDDDKLNSLYLRSHFCFFLSRNEGYGLPLVEAMWLRSIPIISDIPIFNEILGKSYPKFDNNSGYNEAIKKFIIKLFDDKNYLISLFQELDKIVVYEKDGYKRSAENLVRYIQDGICE